MTSAIPAVPSGLPEDLYHSAPMVLVRYPSQAVFGSTAIRKGLAIKALALASLCAALAFFLSAVRERKLAPMPAATHAPIAAPKPAAAEPALAPMPRHVSLPERPDRKITEFILSASPEFQNLGPVKLRLTDVDAQLGSYNLAVQIRGRQFNRSKVKLDEAVKLWNGKRAAPEIVVGAIVQNRVWGYLSEPRAKAQPAHSRHKRRR